MPKEEHHYYVYILANRSRTLYTGVTNQLVRRIEAHRDGSGSAFTNRYSIHRLVYFEHFTDIRMAIRREKQIKGWLRVKKATLIEQKNPTWEDLYPTLFVRLPVPQYQEPGVKKSSEG
ncbi:GIY-YIG nuclease family protein [Terriglobus albidus]|uniref:GIY-YIG nuclease family protein n=1 Tax=Terriglobus albidus TaxID=1592106 RepID=UPI0021DFA8D7|nr:GIY-YIG nuclease family protein [Terriglobus albidus]